MTTNVERIRAASTIWNDSKGGDQDVWLDLASDGFEMHSLARQPPGPSFTGDQIGRWKMDAYLRTLIEKWEMRYYRPGVILGEGDRVVMFGECSYTFRANGETVTRPIATLWTFKGDTAVSCIEVFDSAEATAKASMPRWNQA